MATWRREWQPTPVFLLENSTDRGAWWATFHGVAKSQTRLSDSHTQEIKGLKEEVKEPRAHIIGPRAEQESTKETGGAQKAFWAMGTACAKAQWQGKKHVQPRS